MEQFEQKWWMELVKGIVVLGFGLYCLICPNQALSVFGIIIGIAMLVVGGIFVLSSLKARTSSNRWWIILIEAGVNILLGVILLFTPKDAVDALIRLLGIWAIVLGIFRFMRLWVFADFDRSLAILSAVGGLLLGIILIIYPRFITMSITVIVGVVLALFGVFIILDAMRQKTL